MTIKRLLLTIFIGDREKWKELNEAVDTCCKEYDKLFGKLFDKLNQYVSKLLHRTRTK
jgi:hypothetical protein